MTPAVRWTLIVLGLLLANLLAMAILIVSSRAEGAQIIPAYYERATQFDTELDDAVRSRELGWTIDTTLAHTTIEVTVRDAAGLPIDGARVVVRGTPRARAAARFEVELRRIAPGRYALPRAHDRGIHDLVIVVERDAARFVAHAVAEPR